MSACVILETPYAAGNGYTIQVHVRYARMCMADCLRRGEAPLASHLLYTQPHVLRDSVEEQRAMGIAAGLQWGAICDYVVVYTDLGISSGMKQSVAIHREMKKEIHLRILPNWTTSTEAPDD